MASTNSLTDINVMLMGKSGHGKSSTGNSILGRKEFISLGGGRSVTKEQQTGYTQVDGRTIKVVDIPGVCDTDFTSTDATLDLVVRAMAAGLRQFPQGFHALLLVLSYTARFTPEEEEAIKSLKLIFGDNVLRDHTIIVFTHGDSFKNDYDGTQIDFKTWCTQQMHYGKLFDECGRRCVMFDNSRSCTRDEKYAQVRELIDLVDSLKDMHTNFTLDKLVAAGEKREEVKRFSLLLEKYSREIGLIKDSLNKIMILPIAERFEKIKEQKRRAAKLLEDLSKEDHEKLTDITAEVQAISAHIHNLEGLLVQQEQDKANLTNAVKERVTEKQKKIDEIHEQINMRIDMTNEKLDKKSEEVTDGIFVRAFKKIGSAILSVVYFFIKKPAFKYGRSA